MNKKKVNLLVDEVSTQICNLILKLVKDQNLKGGEIAHFCINTIVNITGNITLTLSKEKNIIANTLEVQAILKQWFIDALEKQSDPLITRTEH